jgi:hypothetical protein
LARKFPVRGERSKKPPEGGLCSPNFDGSFDHRLIHATTAGCASVIASSRTSDFSDSEAPGTS